MSLKFSSFRTSVTSFFSRAGTYARTHKILSAIILIVIIGAGYLAYHAYAAGKASAEYSLAYVTQAPLQVTVTGSGQVSAEHQLNLSPKASGQLTGVYVTPGQKVSAGTLIATVDDTDAANSVTSAEENLTSAQISYQQTVTSAQNSTTNDQVSIQTASTNLSNALASTFTGLPSIASGFDTALHQLSTLSNYGSEESIDAYATYVPSAEAQQDRENTVTSYAAAAAAYQQESAAYAAYNISDSPEQSLTLAQNSITALQKMSEALRDALTYYNYVNSQVVVGGKATPSQLSTQINNLTSYLNTINSDISNLTGAKTSLMNAQQAYQQDTQTLGSAGPSLTLQTAQLNLQKAQDALAQAREAEADYVVRAPFAGTIASVPLKKYDTASSGTAVAVLITKQNYVDLSLNEADAAKVQVGQPVSVTFDAVTGLTATGTVGEIDQVGTVSQGVVTFTVKVGLNTTDDRILPGMTADAIITTAAVANAIQVPSAAVHTVGNSSYVEVATLTGTSTAAQSTGTQARTTGTDPHASSTGAGQFGTASSTFSGRAGYTGSSTAGFARAGANAGALTRSLTVPVSEVTIARVPVTVGISNDTMTQITSGLSPRQLVVTGTVTAAKKTAAASGAAKTTTGIPGAGAFGGGATVRRAGGAGAAGFGGAARIGG